METYLCMYLDETRRNSPQHCNEGYKVIIMFIMCKCLKVLKNGPTVEEKQLNGENEGPNRNEEVLIKVAAALFFAFLFSFFFH